MMPPPTPKNAEKTPAASPMATRRTDVSYEHGQSGRPRRDPPRDLGHLGREPGGAPAADRNGDLRGATRSATLPVARCCGGYWVAIANGARTRCADGLRHARCYVARAVDAKGHPLGDIAEGALVRGAIDAGARRPRRARRHCRLRTRRNGRPSSGGLLPRRRHGDPLRPRSVLLVPRDAGERLDADTALEHRPRRSPRHAGRGRPRASGAPHEERPLRARPLRPERRTAAGSSAPRGSSSERRSLAPEHVPGEAHVVLGRAEVADREPQHVAIVEPRVREEDLAGVVDALEQPLVVLVGAVAPEADEREVPRRRDLPARARRAPSSRRARRAGCARGSAPAARPARSSAAPPTA